MKHFEFSKAIVSCVMATYFVGLTVGVFAVLAIRRASPEYAVQALTALLTYIGAPTATAIGFYAWKAKNENIHKNPDVTEPGAGQEASSVIPSGTESMDG